MYVACICYTIAFLFAPPKYVDGLVSFNHDDDEPTDVPQNNIYLQANYGLAGHFYRYGEFNQRWSCLNVFINENINAFIVLQMFSKRTTLSVMP